MSNKKINFFLIGAQKAGSTTLYSWLAQHPEINALESIKDFHFFTSEEYFPRGYAWFENLYKKDQGGQKLHGAVNYIYREDAPQKIAKYNPNSKSILVLRDPVKRAFSAYQFYKRLGSENRSFEQALKEEQNRQLKTQAIKDDYAYLDHGFYAQQINRWFSYFDREQCLILLYEQLFDNPEHYLRQIFAFLELNDTNFKVNFESKNVSKEVKYPWMNKLIYNPDSILKKGLNATKIKHLIPVHWRGKLLGSFRDWNTKAGGAKEILSEEMYQNIASLFKEDRQQLENILDKTLTPFWKY